jgi:hypothetical protein
MKISPNGKETSTHIPITLGTTKKYNYNGDFDEITIDDIAAITAGPTFTASDGTCDNFALEYHLSIQYEALPGDSSEAASFKLTKATVDVIYGKLTPLTADTPVTVTR